MKHFIILFISLFFSLSLSAQIELVDSNMEYGKSYLNQKCPQFDIKEWVSEKANVKGKFVLIDFWAIWAYPCTHFSVPYLNMLSKKYEKDLAVIALSQEHPFYIKQMVDPKIEYYNATVDSMVIYKTFRIKGYPYSYLIDPDGVVVWQNLTIDDLDIDKDYVTFHLTEDVLRKLIADYKNKKNKK